MFSASDEAKHQCLVVDTNAIVRGVHVERMAKELFTVPEIISEIRDKQTREGVLATLVLPEIKLREPSAEALEQVIAAAKESGDYPFLSEPDLKAVALTLTLFNERNPDCTVPPEKEEVQEPKKEEPKQEEKKTEDDKKKEESKQEEQKIEEDKKKEEQKTEENKKKEPPKSVWGTGANWAAVLAPPTPEQIKAMKAGPAAAQASDSSLSQAQKKKKAQQERAKAELEKRRELQRKREEKLEAKLDALSAPKKKTVQSEDDAMAAAAAAAWGDGGFDDEDDEEEEEEEEGEDEGSDGEGVWITPENLQEMQVKMGGNDICDDEGVSVGCITGDFAMQNVLMKLALDIVGVEGLRIRAPRTWMLKCFSCFEYVRDTNKVFCPKCGNSTLQRIAVESQPDGTFEEVSLVTKAQQFSARHVKVALPPPRGGRNNRDPITCEEELQRRLRSMPKPKKDDVAGLAYDGRYNGRLTIQQQRKLVLSGGVVDHKKRTGKKKKSNH